MASAQEILDGVVIKDRYEDMVSHASVDEELGFLTAPVDWNRLEMGRLLPKTALIGLGVPGWQLAREDLPNITSSITRFHELPEASRELARLNMGVGTRLYNTWQAATGAAEDFKNIGAYALGIDTDAVYDAGRNSGKMRRIAKYGLLKVMESLVGLDGVTLLIHDVQREVDVAIHNQTPSGTAEQARHGVSPLPGIDERLLVVRNPNIILHKIGEIRR